MAPATPSPTTAESAPSEPPGRAWRLPGRPSLARRIQWQMGALMLVAIAAMTTWSYRNTVEQVLSSTQEALRSIAWRVVFKPSHGTITRWSPTRTSLRCFA
jgi:hypothetical protein